MELKPCPFCGQTEAPEVMQEADSFSVYHGSYQVICNTRNCGCGSSSGYYSTIEDAIKKWNRRGKVMGCEYEVYSWEDGVEKLYWQGEELMEAISAMHELELQGFKYIKLEWRPR